MAALGVGPQNPCSLKDFNALTLERLIVEATHADIRTRAKELGSKLLLEDGVGATVDIFLKDYEQNKNCGITLEWMKDESASVCGDCKVQFGFLTRRHHCRSCGGIFCLNCLALQKVPNWPGEQMVCRICYEARAIMIQD